ncbi:hypothetical protein GCM10017556_56200 [Micromonospora sagamiensis]|nr:hypothetical protein GCM10017556_56200 [Micromonospora sagamiensis]
MLPRPRTGDPTGGIKKLGWNGDALACGRVGVWARGRVGAWTGQLDTVRPPTLSPRGQPFAPPTVRPANSVRPLPSPCPVHQAGPPVGSARVGPVRRAVLGPPRRPVPCNGVNRRATTGEVFITDLMIHQID